MRGYVNVRHRGGGHCRCGGAELEKKETVGGLKGQTLLGNISLWEAQEKSHTKKKELDQ